MEDKYMKIYRLILTDGIPVIMDEDKTFEPVHDQLEEINESLDSLYELCMEVLKNTRHKKDIKFNILDDDIKFQKKGLPNTLRYYIYLKVLDCPYQSKSQVILQTQKYHPYFDVQDTGSEIETFP